MQGGGIYTTTSLTHVDNLGLPVVLNITETSVVCEDVTDFATEK